MVVNFPKLIKKNLQSQKLNISKQDKFKEVQIQTHNKQLKTKIKSEPGKQHDGKNTVTYKRPSIKLTVNVSSETMEAKGQWEHSQCSKRKKLSVKNCISSKIILQTLERTQKIFVCQCSSSINHKSQKVETNQMSVNRCESRSVVSDSL